MIKSIIFVSFIMMISFSGSVHAEGTLEVTFKYLDNNGVEQPLKGAYVYLHNGSQKPPMEKLFSQPSLILGPSDSYGKIRSAVPDGAYYIRITRRNPSGITPLGPPRDGDYTWSQTETIAISSNITLNLGTKIAQYFFTTPITISGTVKNPAGLPIVGRYVRAQTHPCIADYGYTRCGPVKHLALQRTDAEGKYTIEIRNPGTYYIYVAPCLGDQREQYYGNPCLGRSVGEVMVQPQENKILNITTY